MGLPEGNHSRILYLGRLESPNKDARAKSATARARCAMFYESFQAYYESELAHGKGV